MRVRNLKIHSHAVVLKKSNPNELRKVSRRCRIVLYSHDTMGLGHMRRNILVAQALTESHVNPTILLIAGAKEVGRFPLPENVDCFVLPAYHKTLDGSYKSRNLDLEDYELHELRANTILSVLQSFKPDVFIVDNVANGALGELTPTLSYLKTQTKTRCVLGLRDIQDELEMSKSQYLSTEKAYHDYYDAIWIYGDPTIYDLAAESYFSADVVKKVSYTGYLDQCHRVNQGDAFHMNRKIVKLLIPEKKLVVCILGGGQDGAKLAEAFVGVDFPENYQGVLVTGPYLPSHIRHRLFNVSHDKKNIHIFNFMKEPGYLIGKADRLITMGGYNSVCEILSLEKKSLIVPRVKPRMEQWVRACRLQQLGVVDVLHPDNISPEKITDWLVSDGPKIDDVRKKIDLNGLHRLSILIGSIARK